MARKSLETAGIAPAVPTMSYAQARAYQAKAWPDIWAMELRLIVDGHPFDILGREYVREVIRDESDWIVIPKGAQTGLTTTFLVRTAHWITQRKWHHLYLLPLKSGSLTFVQQRIDPILDSNPALASHFQRVDNRVLKQSTEGVAWYIHGTNIVTELREKPADVLILDERDKMNEDNLPEAEARLDGSNISRIVELSTPTAPGHGVDADDGWRASDQHRWWVACPACAVKQVFTFEENVLPWLGDRPEESELHCQHCKKLITDGQRAAMNAFGRWEPDNLKGSKRGYHISQLNSPTKKIQAFVKNYFTGQRDVKRLKAFYNNQLGLPFVAEGDQITWELMQKRIGAGYSPGGIPPSPIYVGVDVGHKILHVESNVVSRFGQLMLWDTRLLHTFKQLDDYLAMLPNFLCVVDSDPARREVEALSLKYSNRVWMGFTKDAIAQGDTAVFSPTKYGEVCSVRIEKTMAMDTLIWKYLHGQRVLPPNVSELGENMPNLPYNGYVYQHLQIVRVEEEDAKGVIRASWKKNKNPDHWHHASMFSLVASMRDVPLVIDENVNEMFNSAGSMIGA